jgi:hydroxysqualene dehydroxylase
MPDVIVIGGGFAGLSAATALVENGASVHLVEARPSLGGRATSFRDPTTGERIDNGHHVLAGCYVETLTFLRRLGTLDKLHWPSTLRLPMVDERGRRSALVLPPLPAPLHLIGGVLAWDALSLRERLSVLRLGSALRGRWGVTENLTVHQWLRRHGQPARLCEMLWEPLTLAALNQSIDVAGATSFLTVLSRMFGPDPSASTLLMAAVPLDDLAATPTSSRLRSAGSQVTTNAPARIVVSEGRVSGVVLRDRMFPAPVVIAAVPWFALADLFDEVPASLEGIVANASALGSSPIVTVNLWFGAGQRLDEVVIGLPARSFQWVFDKGRLVESSQSHLSMVASGADEICAASNRTVVKMALDELTGALPAFRQAPLRHAVVLRERRATFSLRPGGPPRPSTRTPVAGLILAGDWIDTGLPATIESAVVSGHRAAAAALECLEACSQ